MKDRRAFVRHMITQTRNKCEQQKDFLNNEMMNVERTLRPLKRDMHRGCDMDDDLFAFTMCLICRNKMHRLFQDAYGNLMNLKTDFSIEELHRHVKRHIRQVNAFSGKGSVDAVANRHFFTHVYRDIDAKQHLLQKIL